MVVVVVVVVIRGRRRKWPRRHPEGRRPRRHREDAALGGDATVCNKTNYEFLKLISYSTYKLSQSLSLARRHGESQSTFLRRATSLALSLSLYIYIYIYMIICMCVYIYILLL